MARHDSNRKDETMPDPDTDETEAPAFAGAEPLETPAGESPPLPADDETETGEELAERLADHMGLHRRPEPDEDDDEDEGDEVAPGSPEDDTATTDTAEVGAEPEETVAAAEAAIDELEAAGVPRIDTDDEHAAYWSGYRAGGDDPGWLLTLAEMGRHLGSFFEPAEEEAFNAMSAEDFWSRWTLGYLDATAGRLARPERPRAAKDMDW